MVKLEVVWCGSGVTDKVSDELCLHIIECGEVGRVVINDKVGHNIPQDLGKEKEDVKFMEDHARFRLGTLPK